MHVLMWLLCIGCGLRQTNTLSVLKKSVIGSLSFYLQEMKPSEVTQFLFVCLGLSVNDKLL